MEVDLRPAAAEDEAFLRELDRAVVTERLGLGDWGEEARTSLLEIQDAARRRDRAARFPAAVEQVVVVEGGRVGRLTVDRSPARLLIVDVAVSPAVRRRGIAAALIRAVGAEADRAGVPVAASADPGNSASRRLFARAGFRELADDGANVSLERPAGRSALSVGRPTEQEGVGEEEDGEQPDDDGERAA